MGGTMGLCHKAVLMSALCAGMLVQADARAQAGFFITYSLLGVASCDATHLEGTVTATYNLPAPPNNLFSSIAINGGPPITDLSTINPPLATSPLVFNLPVPSTPQPYTIRAIVFPALNGATTGAGVSATYTCNANGTVTAVFDPVVAGGIAVPTLSQWGLAALASLLALGSWLQLRRKS
jgi:IPTL-CTERM motif